MSLATDYAAKAGDTPMLAATHYVRDDAFRQHPVAHIYVQGGPKLFIPASVHMNAQEAVSFAKDILRVFGEGVDSEKNTG